MGTGPVDRAVDAMAVDTVDGASVFDVVLELVTEPVDR
jgi:hypothetical protein